MGLLELMSAAREAAGPSVWGTAVQLARDGAVVGLSDDGDEVHLQVKVRGRALPHEVHLWPEEDEWGCDCGQNVDCCVHVAAAIIAHKNRGPDEALPVAKKSYSVKLRYAFETDADALVLHRRIVKADGTVEALRGTLSESNLQATRSDALVESLLVMHPGGGLGADLLRRALAFLIDATDVTVDGLAVKVEREALKFRVKVRDDGEAFKVGLFRPAGIDRLFRGAALVGTKLHPTSHGDLTEEQRKMLVQGVRFSQDEVGRLVGEMLPRLREKIPVDVDTKRLPRPDDLIPEVLIGLAAKPEGLEVRTEIVYGNPPVARVVDGVFKITGDIVPFRDPAAERAAARRFEERMGRFVVGFAVILPPDDAADFLRNRLPLHDGPVVGHVDPSQFKITEGVLRPNLQVRAVPQPKGAPGDEPAWSLDVSFEGDHGEADPMAVLMAWRTGRSLVPLLEGGFAPLPVDWLQKHGAVLRELLDARDGKGRVDRNATAALVELLEGSEGEVPPDLTRLRAFLEGAEGLPEVAHPPALVAELRPYQEGGFRWLMFLAGMDLHGILADDMGLGKTVQALAAMAATPGDHLVVAPTSVIYNWAREIERFIPGTTVNLYHGPTRNLKPARITLTSYALLRLDVESLVAKEWAWVVLDEAQSIKNATSQTARSALQLRAQHRLCLTGTPVENRLEELWSLFRFLMPGLLGSLEAFRDRFVRPIEAGEGAARKALQARVKPYVLRRLKQQVAKELPPLTDLVVRCEMSEAQRGVYDAMRLSARKDVQDALAKRGERGATFAILEALLRMRQACCDPSLLPGDNDAPSAKLDQLEELLVDVVTLGHKALVFSQWTSLLDRVEPRLQALGIGFTRLDGSTIDRPAVVDKFQADDGPPVFLLSLKAGGTGLNLTAADYVFHLDPWWNPAVQQQATDRAHRIGQDKPVISYKLIAAGTVEERILELQDAKRDLASAALGDDGGFLKALSADELRSLFEAA